MSADDVKHEIYGAVEELILFRLAFKRLVAI